jgi:hypothetical protein
MGSHWEPFYDDAQEALLDLPAILKQSLMQTGYGEVYAAKRETPEHWLTGWHLAWPYRTHGLMATIRTGNGANELVSVFPFQDAGIQHSVIIHQVIVWESGVEAQIEVSLGPAFFCALMQHGTTIVNINSSHAKTRAEQTK